MIKQLMAVLLLGLTMAFVGCAPTVEPPSEPRSPTSPGQVEVFQKQPSKYQLLGTVEVPIAGAIRMDERGDATAGYQELKKRAADMGANGILLDPKVVQSQGVVTCADNGTFYQVPVDYKPKVARAQAIWVYSK